MLVSWIIGASTSNTRAISTICFIWELPGTHSSCLYSFVPQKHHCIGSCSMPHHLYKREEDTAKRAASQTCALSVCALGRGCCYVWDWPWKIRLATLPQDRKKIWVPWNLFFPPHGCCSLPDYQVEGSEEHSILPPYSQHLHNPQGVEVRGSS